MKNKSFLFLSTLIILFFGINYSNAYLSVSSDGALNITTSDGSNMTVGSDGAVNMITSDSSMDVSSDGAVNMTTSDGSNMTVGSDGAVNITNFTKNITEEQKSMKDLMKNLENELKSIRESITKENFEELKIKVEELKNIYIEKASSINEETKKMVNNRFDFFFKNQFVIRDQIVKIKEEFNTKKDEMKKNLEMYKEDMKAKGEFTKENIKKIRDDMNLKKEEFKQKAEMYKENIKMKKDEIKNNVSDLRKNFKQTKEDLKLRYKEKFKTQLATRLDIIPEEKLKKVLEKIEAKIEKIENSKMSETSKEKVLAQLYALRDLINEKLGIETDEEEEINIDELLNTEE